MATKNPSNVIIIHPDLGIGGAERLIIDVALALQNRGHQVTIYTSHRDKSHCFEEARDGTLDVRVRGNTVFPPLLWGRFHLLMAMLRQLHLTASVLREMGRTGKDTVASKSEGKFGDDIFIIDQLPACVPVLKWFGERFALSSSKQRILFYCHFPDQLLARRNEGGSALRLLKGAYRYPLDWFEGWAMSASDKVVANSNFTKGVVRHVFGSERLGDVSVVYPCVDTKESKQQEEQAVDEGAGELWGGKKILLSINRFEKKKGIDLAIRAYNGLSTQDRTGTRLVIAGGYDNRVQENVQYHKELNELALGFGLQTATAKTVISALSIPDSIDVLFLLSVPSAFRDTLLHHSKLLLYTPVNEHFGIVPVEAMHAGLPVLASNTGGPLESIVEDKTGWLRETKNVDEWTAIMRRVLVDLSDADFQVMARNGVDRVESEFSLRALEDKLEGEIQGMLSTARRSFVDVQQVVLGFLLSGIFGAVAVAFILRSMKNL
ncbi:alpha-1,3/alpha-1,6-mannosyltransferase [Talaromyces islandicus]|uniref:Alpha-1,3/1,6-mannosyltransferase ALG2 n=1 Tax=Talaromyces islandicus TaxID=28573 RepID=A0A0U1LLF8_TALIS|nr:alpha-1,3/alpha-1,6-mannosyltransferase [Talaromyces islandicus]